MKKKQKTEGIGFIEIIIVIAMLAVGVLAFLGMVLQGLKVTHYSREMVIAKNFAQGKMEEIKSKNYNEIIDDSFEYRVPARSFLIYSIRVKDNIPSPKLKTITILVKSIGPVKKLIELETIIAQ